MRRFLSIVLSLAALGACLLQTDTAEAGGMYFTDRGTRPMGRGFAFVAGADDAGALWYNPAGLAFVGRSAFLDTTLTLADAEFTRIDGGGRTLPTVALEPHAMPIPMLAYTEDFGLENFNFGAGVLAPNLLPTRWPDEVSMGGNPEPAPQRYSILNLDGSAVVHLVAGGAWRPIPELSVGMTAHLITGRLRALKTLSACDRILCTQPENPEYDSLTELDLPFVGVTATAGVMYDAGPVRLGGSFTLPHRIGGDATLRVRLPSAAAFDGAFVDGDSADVTLDMAWIARAGVELRAVDDLKVEAAVVYEGWSIQDELRVEPEGVYIRNMVAIGDYQIGPVAVPRQMNDVVSVRLGGEYAIGAAGDVVARTGVNYETAAFDDEYLTPLTLDADKVVLGLGASVRVSEGLWVDASYGHVFMPDRSVRNSRVPQENPIRPPPADGPAPDGPVYIGNGDYTQDANMFGIGLRWTITPPPAFVEPASEDPIVDEPVVTAPVAPEPTIEPEPVVAEVVAEPEPAAEPAPAAEPTEAQPTPRRRRARRRARRTRRTAPRADAATTDAVDAALEALDAPAPTPAPAPAPARRPERPAPTPAPERGADTPDEEVPWYYRNRRNDQPAQPSTDDESTPWYYRNGSR